MEIINTTLHVGVEKPFTFLQMTDTHLTRTDYDDSEAYEEENGEAGEGEE